MSLPKNIHQGLYILLMIMFMGMIFHNKNQKENYLLVIVNAHWSVVVEIIMICHLLWDNCLGLVIISNEINNY